MDRAGDSPLYSGRAVSHPTLSVLIVTYNERELVERCLPPLVDQLDESDELIVADNCSNDGTVEAVERIAPKATVIRMPTNEGLMPACNAAAEQATGDVLIKLDADAVVGPGFCTAIRRPLLEGRSWDGWMGLLTMQGGRLINTSGGVSHFTGISWTKQIGEPVAAARESPHDGVAFLTGACLAMTKEAWERDRGFPSDYFLYFEDVDWSFRARLFGGRLGVQPDARVDHLYDFAKRRVKWRFLERNRWATIIRTYPRELLLLIAPALAATELALHVIAARGGWFGEKLRADGDVVRWLPRLLRERRDIQAKRTVSALEFARPFTAELSSPYLGRASRSRLLRVLLEAYWRVVLAALARAGRP
jgi:GT2 family glycosyltransferase